MTDFKQDLLAYQGQQGQTSVGDSPGSQVNPNFNDDIQQYRSENNSPLVAEQTEYNKKVENTNVAIREKQQSQMEEMQRTADEQQRVANAPETMDVTPNIEIDYANANLNSKNITAVPEGTIGGQCAVYAENVVKMPGGGNWVVGDTVQEKANSLKRYSDAGLGFYKGEDMPQVGNAVILNPGTKWGHVAVINSINPDGTMTLTESNLNWDKKVTHSRKINMNSPSILGFLRTQ